MFKTFINLFLLKGCDFMKRIYYFLFTLFLIFVFLFSYSSFSYCAYPKIVNKLVSAFEKIESYIIAIATPAAAVAIGAGFLMQKFSFGDEERIRIGKKLIRTSIISYTFILLLDLLLSAIKSLVG